MLLNKGWGLMNTSLTAAPLTALTPITISPRTAKTTMSTTNASSDPVHNLHDSASSGDEYEDDSEDAYATSDEDVEYNAFDDEVFEQEAMAVLIAIKEQGKHFCYRLWTNHCG